MNLLEFVSKYKTQEKAAEKLQVSQGMISHWVNHRYEITPNTAVFLEKRSNGEISKHDLLPEIFGAKIPETNE